VTGDEQAAIRKELHEALKAVGVRQEEVAEAFGCSRPYVVQMLTGERPLRVDLVCLCIGLIAQRATGRRAAQAAAGHLLIRNA
jgi:transcriptional regulator with XRE-family HTH domain